MEEEKRTPNVVERRRLYYHDPAAAGPQCFNCAHFVQHYIKDRAVFRLVSSGHCMFPRGKLRNAYDTCGHWKAREERR